MATKRRRAEVKPKKAKFTVKQRKLMVGDLEKVDYQALVDSTVQQLQSGLHLQRYNRRREFVWAICETQEVAKTALVACILEMVTAFLDIYRSHMEGKRAANMEHEWLRHSEDYLTSEHVQDKEAAPLTVRSERKRMWDSVISAAAVVGPTVDIQDQRLILSTLCCIVYDLMVETVKNYKLHHSDTEAPSNSSAVDDESTDMFQLRESNVSLYRYGGFALHSMLKKRMSQSKTRVPSAQHGQEWQILQYMKIQKERWAELPIQIQQLQNGGLEMITPDLLPFLRQLVEKVASHVNDHMRQEHGSEMIKVAKKQIEEDKELREVFKNGTHLEHDQDAVQTVYAEFCSKVFHSRVNEYIVASEEMELEKAGKAVKVEQCLRDELKTFSALRGRS